MVRSARAGVRTPRLSRVAGYAAWTWVMAFIAIHFYWYLGGRIGHPNPLPNASRNVFTVVFTVVVIALFVAGTVVPLASVRPWGHVMPRWMLLSALWAGCAILLLRGGAGVVDELLRVTGLSSTGLTGLTREEVTGLTDPSAAVLWSGRAIDAYFLLGGILFGFAARAYHRSTQSPPEL
jgi:hypothetical protein